MLAPCEGGFELWHANFTGTTQLSDDDRSVLHDYLGADFDPPTNPKDPGTRLPGAVVEHLWAAIAPTLPGGWGVPIHVEHDHFSVIDPGGDGLAVYDLNDGMLRFRLWESKRHDSNGSLTDTITGAAGQLRSNGGQYLARLSKPLQLAEDQRIADLAGRLARLWRSED